MAVKKYTRVKDKATGHEYDILAHRFDAEKHTRLDQKRYPDVSRPRAAKPNVKGKRPATPPAQRDGAAKRGTTAKPAADSKTDGDPS